MRQNLRLENTKVVGVLGIGCTSRYHAIQENRIQFDLRGVLQTIQDHYPHSVYAGCYMDGEVGVMFTGAESLVPMIDLVFMFGTVSWIEDQRTLDRRGCLDTSA